MVPRRSAGRHRLRIAAQRENSLWVPTETGIAVPVGGSIGLSLRPTSDYFGTFRRFSRITLSAREIFDEAPDRGVAQLLLTAGPLRLTLALLSRCALTLSSAKYEELPEVQRELARAFLPPAALDRMDEWIRTHPSEPEVYFLSEQQLLTAMTFALAGC
jgi:hypothetical protein